MAAAGLTPKTIVLAFGAGALGFPDALALRLLLVDGAGRSCFRPLHDIATCVVAMAVLTAYALGTLLLARFVRKQPPGPGARAPRAPPTESDPFACVTLVVSLGAAALVFACLLVTPGAGGGLGLLYGRIILGIAGRSRVVVSVAVASAAVGATIFAASTRTARNAAADAPTPSAGIGKLARAPFLTIVSVVALVCCLLLAITYAPEREPHDAIGFA